MFTSAHGVARTIMRRLGHPARARKLLRKIFVFFERKSTFRALAQRLECGLDTSQIL